MPKSQAYSYVRMSTDLQLKGDSLRRQTQAAKAYVEANDLELVSDLALEDIGVSAFKGKNLEEGALGRFRTAVQTGRVPKGSYLLVESLDRLSREKPQVAATLFLEILNAGVNIVTLIDNRVYQSNDTSFTDIIFSIIMMSRAHDESQTKSVRVSQAWANKRAQATTKKLTRSAPTWLKLSEDRSVFEPIAEKVDRVRRIFDDAENGKGSYQISRALNQINAVPLGAANGWHESFVTKILTNRAVLGEFQPHQYVAGRRVPSGDPIPDYYPRIIEPEQFERVQFGRKVRRVTGSGRKGRKNINLFSQVAKCAYCLGSMMVVDKGPGPKGGVYLRCENARRANNCSATSWPLSHFETAFLHFVKEVDLHQLVADGNDKSFRQELEKAALDKRAQINRTTEYRERAFELLLDPTSEASFINEKISELSANIRILEDELQAIQSEIIGTRIFSDEANRDVATWISASNDNDQRGTDARIRISNWIKLNIKELLVFSDGLDFPVKTVPPERPSPETCLRQFSVMFFNGVFRSVRLIGADPTAHAISIYADDKHWTSEDALGNVSIEQDGP